MRECEGCDALSEGYERLERENETLRAILREVIADIDDTSDGKLPEISSATIARARQAANLSR